MALTLNGALGAILVTFFKMYLPQGHTTEQIVQLLTLPALFVGVGKNDMLQERVLLITFVFQAITSSCLYPWLSVVDRSSWALWLSPLV